MTSENKLLRRSHYLLTLVLSRLNSEEYNVDIFSEFAFMFNFTHTLSRMLVYPEHAICTLIWKPTPVVVLSVQISVAQWYKRPPDQQPISESLGFILY